MIAVLSDIHGNLPALKVVLEEIEDAELVLCAGDLVGYNPYPNEVIWEVKRRNILCIRGNHDRAVVYDDYSRFNPHAATAAMWTRDELSKISMDYLQSLKDSMVVNVGDLKIAIHHGAPYDEDHYVYPEEVSEGLLRYDEPDILVLGHTHVPFVKKFGDRIILNPGSVGQPRDGDPRAAYAILDPKRNVYEIKRVEYPIDEVHDKILERGLPRYLADRLYFGH